VRSKVEDGVTTLSFSFDKKQRLPSEVGVR
jgi:hypothetical protein